MILIHGLTLLWVLIGAYLAGWLTGCAYRVWRRNR